MAFQSAKELTVYRKAFELAVRIFEVSKRFPKEETYALTGQIRRSSRSIGAQIAEAWGKRQYERHFVSKLTDADSEQLESQHWTDVAFDCGYLKEEQHGLLVANLSEIGKMLYAMITKADQFCGALDH